LEGEKGGRKRGTSIFIHYPPQEERGRKGVSVLRKSQKGEIQEYRKRRKK